MFQNMRAGLRRTKKQMGWREEVRKLRAATVFNNRQPSSVAHCPQVTITEALTLAHGMTLMIYGNPATDQRFGPLGFP